MEVASHRGNGVGSTSGVEMEQRLLLDRVHCSGDEPAVDQGVKPSAAVLPDLADASLSGEDEATMGTEVAAHLILGQPLIEQGLLGRFRFHRSHLIYSID